MKAVEGSMPWATSWQGPESVVYGHAVYSLSEARLDEHDGYTCYGIDTGCVFGGQLTALVVSLGDHSGKVVLAQTQAREEYFPLRLDREPGQGISSE